jgi:hypothetical protein
MQATVQVPVLEILNTSDSEDRRRCCADLCNSVSDTVTESSIPEKLIYNIWMCNRSELLDAQYPLHASKVLGSGFRPQGVTLHLYDMDICF